MTKNKLDINSSTTVHQLLSEYPELEDKLIAMAPPFKKLRNPALKNSIAKIATLKNIASVGKISLIALINNIRQEVGQPIIHEEFKNDEYFTPKPHWFSKDKISVSLVDGKAVDKDKMAVLAILKESKKLKEGEIIELITTFLPAPLIDTMKSKGYSVWTTTGEEDTIRTYYIKKIDS